MRIFLMPEENKLFVFTESIIEYKTKGAIIRSRARWYNEGEKNNKYFLGLENHHCNKKKIMQIKAKDGANLSNDSDILFFTLVKAYLPVCSESR